MSATALIDDGAARHLTPGHPLPDVNLPSTAGETVAVARLHGAAVLFVYPWTGRPDLPNPPNWDDIPGAHGSTPEAEGFRDQHAAFRDLGVAVFGISGQDTAYQREFATRLGLPFPLLSDESFALRDGLALPTFTTGGVTYLKRLTLLIESGRIARIAYPVDRPGQHAAEFLADLTRSR